MLEKIEVGKVYLDSNGFKSTILTIGEKSVFIRAEDGSEGSCKINWVKDNWSEIPTPKKRYWLWDVDASGGGIYKTSTYLDDDGIATNKVKYFDKERLIKKHENEWIEV